MSAIAGIFNLNGAPVEQGLLQTMTGVVKHRGADGIGHWESGPVALGHLSLVTTPEAAYERQPLTFDDGKSALVWDGRLDNREQLADQLGLRSKLANLTDPDLVLTAYQKWDKDAFKRLIGDFAFAIWDGRRQELVSVRDPIGVRPFHYFFDGQRFVFGTEIKQIFQDRSVPQNLNEVMIGLALCSSFSDGVMTFYKGVKRLLGGYWIAVSRSGLRTSAFWDPDPNDEIKFRTREEYAERFREILIEAVRCRLRSSTGVEVALSGGVDSSSVASVAGLLRKQGLGGNAPLTAHTCVHDDAELDETPFVMAVADRYQIPVTRVPVDDRWAMKQIATARNQDEPYQLHFEGIQNAALTSASTRGIRVLLTGEGGDETSIYGYMLHTHDWFRRLRWLSIWRDLRGSAPDYRAAGIAAIRHTMIPDWLQRWHGRDAATIPQWVRPEFIEKTNLRAHLWAAEPGSRRESLYLQMRGRLQLFLGSDIRGAAYGVEYRHPLWDARVVEFLSRIPPQVRFEGGREKPLVRYAMAGILPDEIRVRQGHGAFGMLVERGLREREAERIRRALSESELDSIGAIDAGALRETFEAYVGGNDAKRARVMPTLLVEDWLRTRRGKGSGSQSADAATPAGAI